jgi:lincosamide nucleotidyltransferase A/C/D/E
LLEEQTRIHSDLDLWLPAAHLERLFVAFAERGVDRVFPWPGDRPWNFVLHDGVRLRVDLHLYEPLPDRSLHYGSAIDGVVFPAGALTGQGSIAGMAVRCEAPEWAVHWHTGYPPRAVDRHDVPLLCERFGIDLPETFC